MNDEGTEKLSPKEQRKALTTALRKEVTRLQGEGLRASEIASRLGLSEIYVYQLSKEYKDELELHRTLEVLKETVGPEIAKQLMDRYPYLAKGMVEDHQWAPTYEQVTEWAKKQDERDAEIERGERQRDYKDGDVAKKWKPHAPAYTVHVSGPDGFEYAGRLTRAQVGEILLILEEAEPANYQPEQSRDP
jgi:hypothetical protein